MLEIVQRERRLHTIHFIVHCELAIRFVHFDYMTATACNRGRTAAALVHSSPSPRAARPSSPTASPLTFDDRGISLTAMVSSAHRAAAACRIDVVTPHRRVSRCITHHNTSSMSTASVPFEPDATACAMAASGAD